MEQLAKGAASDAKQLASTTQVTKVTSELFPTEDVIQDMPVSLDSSVEEQPYLFRAQSNVAGTTAGESPADSVLAEGPPLSSEGERSSPFLIELFCGTAGVCAQFKTRWQSFGNRSPSEENTSQSCCSQVGPDTTMGARTHRT